MAAFEASLRFGPFREAGDTEAGSPRVDMDSFLHQKNQTISPSEQKAGSYVSYMFGFHLNLCMICAIRAVQEGDFS